ncbi:MAG: 4-vinyl reductase [Clostridiales bacterium]|jgi:predicted hydrocarbon binding protein|nr:4-vinyl reductase [Clostridiales bacterium]
MKALGDIDSGRPNLGGNMPVFVYRLFELSVADILEKNFGKDKTDEIIRSAGFQSGIEYAKNYLDLTLSFNDFVELIQKQLVEHKIGILRVEYVNLEKGEIILTVYEDLDCSGLPVYDETVCVYDEGFLSGILQTYTGKPFKVREIDCWATGDRACRFVAKTV